MTRLALTVFAATLSIAAQPPTFRAGADIVEVDVVVQDKSGRFVGDLTAQDFIVREEGAPQRIDLFYVINGNNRIAVLNSPGASPAPTGARAAPRVFILFFDDQHLTPAGFKRVQA